MSDERTVWYGGIADIGGLESCIFLFDREQAVADALAGQKLGQEQVDGCEMLNVLELRARFNPQRHPVVYTARLTREQATKIGDVLRQDAHAAYYVLLLEAEEIRVHRSQPEDFLRLPEVAKALDRKWETAKEALGTKL